MREVKGEVNWRGLLYRRDATHRESGKRVLGKGKGCCRLVFEGEEGADGVGVRRVKGEINWRGLLYRQAATHTEREGEKRNC